MATKKDESRFTVRFNQENPRHKEAMRILNRHGKGMASLIADALCVYVQIGANFVGDLVKEEIAKTHPNHVQEEVTTSSKIFDEDVRNKLNAALDSFG